MIALSQVNAALRRQNRKNYLLLVLCNFISVLLITAYVTMMRSPTVLQVLPEGGDSRKQVMMIFVPVSYTHLIPSAPYFCSLVPHKPSGGI